MHSAEVADGILHEEILTCGKLCLLWPQTSMAVQVVQSLVMFELAQDICDIAELTTKLRSHTDMCFPKTAPNSSLSTSASGKNTVTSGHKRRCAMESFTLASTVLVSSLLLCFIYVIGLSIYRLLLHPLASFPGPRLAALTFAYETYYDVFVAPGGQFTYELDRLHDIYGPVIRINPDEIHVRESTFFDTLYAGPGHRRDKWERANRANASPGSVASAVSHDLHRARRAAINPFFSKRAITQLENGIRERVERLVARLHTDYAGTDRVVDIGAAFTAVTFDVISEYCFDDCYNVLDEPDFGPRWKALMGGLFEAVPVTKQFPIVARIMAALPSWLVQKLMPDMEVFMGLKLQIDKKVREVYAEYRTSSHASTSQVPAKTLFDGIMQSTLPPSEKSVERLSDESFVLLVAGGETTARVMTVIIAQLIENSSLLARLREELDSVMEKELPPSRILEELPLLKAVIQEGNRFATPVTNRPILRAPDENLTTKDGWVIPRNTPTSMTLGNIHMDADIFSDPQLFDPNRWLGSERLDRYLVTFSKGTRSCVGINLAYTEMYLGIAAVVRNFDFEFFDFDQKRDLDVVRDCFIGLPSKESRGVRVKKICRRRGRRVQPQACEIPARTPALPRVNAYCYVDFCAPRSPSLGKRKIKQCDTGDTYSSTIVPLSALLDMAGSQESELANIQSPSLGTGKDGLDKVELSDLDASPPPLPVEQDLMQLARLGELRSIQKLFDSGRFTARSTDEQGIQNTSQHFPHRRQGIGRAITLAYAAEGADLILVSRSEDKLHTVAHEATNVARAHAHSSSRVIVFAVSVSDGGALAQAVKRALRAFGVTALDVVVNNAGIALGAPQPFWQQSLTATVGPMLDTNVHGFMTVAHVALNQGGMAAAGRGTILNVTSTTALETPPFPGEAVYHASKACQEGFTNALRAELVGTNVRVLALRPGVVQGHFHEQRVGGDADEYQGFMQGIEALVAEDVAKAAVWMLSSDERVSVRALDVVPSSQRTLAVFDRKWEERNRGGE
nr:trichodiene oxygenase [Quercus suber]